ncbi:transformation/transcription domain-associated protein-like [Cucumis melo var. makuwa]|uniref:Transformation/transcription domain-associated protein-like n=1 Tax=Cucumis melo var. makuwa TaxID=1194695 RepID=A0A5A7VKU9_CUCMM|nr:transformation/transcription domain-associated protein-like [Cucumis melo var. makuwa]
MSSSAPLSRRPPTAANPASVEDVKPMEVSTSSDQSMNSGCTGTVQLNPSTRSFKIETESPLVVMFLFQLYSRLVQTNIPLLLPLMVSAISVSRPEKVPPSLKTHFIELKGAQVKMLASISILVHRKMMVLRFNDATKYNPLMLPLRVTDDVLLFHFGMKIEKVAESSQLLDGFGIGLVVTLVHIYISETATSEIRGFRPKSSERSSTTTAKGLWTVATRQDDMVVDNWLRWRRHDGRRHFMVANERRRSVSRATGNGRQRRTMTPVAALDF